MSARLTDNSTVCSKRFQVNNKGIVNPPNKWPLVKARISPRDEVSASDNIRINVDRVLLKLLI